MIERFVSKRTSIDYTTRGLISTEYDSEIEYDKLLNKYYKLLLKKLEDSNIEILTQAQRNWIQYRESESILNSLMSDEEYSGCGTINEKGNAEGPPMSDEEYSGCGTIQGILYTSRDAEITKNRVIELFDYLSRIIFQRICP